MNRFDIEFWNGSLKGIMLAEKEIEKIMEKDEGAYMDGLRIARKAVKELKSRVEGIHTEDILKALRD